MKTLFKITLACCICTCLAACKKSNGIIFTPSSAINVTNAVVGGATLTFGSTTQTVRNYSYNWFPVLAGQSQVNLNIPATSTTQAIFYYNQTQSITNGMAYSLFLAGPSPSSIDAVLITEKYTPQYADSVCGVRFINLSPGSNPISVDIQGQPLGSEANTLAYKAYSDFKQYPAKAINTSYLFEFRDSATGNLLTTYRLSTPFFHNVTLALRGSPSSPGIILDNDY
jgi:hypothetical protein